MTCGSALSQCRVFVVGFFFFISFFTSTFFFSVCVQSDSGSDHEEKKGKGKTRAKKDPNAPKRAMSGYMAYGAKRRPELKVFFVSFSLRFASCLFSSWFGVFKKVSDPKMAFGDITKLIAQEWNA